MAEAAAPSRTPWGSPWLVGVILLAVAVWTLDLVVFDAGVPHPLDDSWENAIVARMLIEGRGFRSHMIYPPLWEYRDPSDLTIPVLVHGPLVPLVLALPLRLFGPSVADHMAWIAAVFAVLTLVPLFRLASRHFGEPVAAGAAALFTLSPLTVAAVNHYLAVVIGAFLLTWSLDLLARERPRPVAAGIVAGLCSLARPEMSLAAPVLAFLATRDRRDLRPAGMFLIAFVATAAWWGWERWRVTGSPFFNLSSYMIVLFSPAFPGDSLVRDFASPPSRFPSMLSEAMPELWRKWLHFFPRAVKRSLTTPNTATGWVSWIGAVGAIASPRTRRLAIGLVLLAAIPLISITLLASVRLYPVPFLAISCMFAAFGAQLLFDRLPEWARRPRAWLLALALVAVPSVVLELREQADEARKIERWLAADRAALAASIRTPENAGRLMFSDTPDFVAWTTGRPTVWLQRKEFDRLYGTEAPDLPATVPPRPEPRDTWFHTQDPIDPTNQSGTRIEP